MKKISILLLTLVSLAFLGLYGVEESYAADTDVSFDISVVRRSEVTNELGIVGQFGQSMSFDPKGLDIDEFKFAYHILNGQVLEEASQQVMVSGSTNLIVVVEKPDHPVTTYIDTNGELLGVNDAPSAVPTKPGFEFDGYVQVEGTEKLVFVANYSKNNEDPILVSIIGGTKNLDEVQYNDIVTLTPNEGEFSYWADEDGQVVSRKANYKFSALQDVTLTAVFEKPANNSPVIYLSNVSGINASNHSFLGYVEGDFVEYGLLASSEVEVLTFDTAGVVTMPSQSLNPLTNEFLRSVPESSEFKSFRAYGKLADGTVLYSDNNYVLEEIQGGEIYTETFDDAELTATYSDGSFVGVNSIVWSYGHSRDEGDTPINGSGIMLRRASDSYLEATLPNGLSALSFKYRKGFTGNNDRQIEVTVNGKRITTTEIFGENEDVYELVLSNLNYSESATIKIKNVGNTSTNRQTIIDDISWTEYGEASKYWDKLYQHRVSFDSNGGIDNITDQLVYHGDLVEKPIIDPTHEILIFAGWFTEIEDGVEFDFENTMITQDITLYARWVEQPKEIFATDLFISEYIEGSSNNKAIEIYNGTGVNINLNGYSIVLYTNGSTTIGSTLNLQGTLKHGETYVIVHNQSNSSFKALANLENGGITGFNGDDVVALRKNNVVIDIIGEIGKRINSWENQTLVRKSNVISPKAVYDGNEWDTYPIDTLTFLGNHIFDPLS